jgi:UDP-N-acetylmuramyl pentapeptide phosphotransferase/UDP-N-acetylglucosamine-1-phosphate transferase
MNSAGAGLIVGAAAAISASLIFILLPLLRRHALAHPNARSSHSAPTPQGGGIAVLGAAFVVAACAILSGGRDPTFDQAPLWWLFAASLLMALVGAVDDLKTLAVAPRLLLQIVAVAMAVASLPAGLRVAPALPFWTERGLLLIACLWFVNLTNFMDGIDWMTVAEFVPIAAGLTVIGWMGGLPLEGVVIALALGGAILGFAPFNRPVARVFLGDVGSLPIGLLFAWLLALLAGGGHLAAAMILPLYYLADTTLTLLRRIINREPFWLAHRSHFYQRATDRGWSVSEIVARVFAVNLALVALAVASVLWPSPQSGAIALAFAAALVAWLLHTFSRGKP